MCGKLDFGIKREKLAQNICAFFACFVLPFSVTAGHAESVDELQAILDKVPKECGSDYRIHSYVDYRECDTALDMTSGIKCVDEVARKNAIIWKWNSFVRDCRASENRTRGSPSLPERSDVPLTSPPLQPPSFPPAPAPTVVTPTAPEPTPTARTPNPDSEEVAALVKRGRQLAEAGDVAAARLVLRRAAEAHSAQAALALGGMYDPIVLKTIGVQGTVPDIAEARSWYEKAKEYGSAEATRRLEILAGHEH